MAGNTYGTVDRVLERERELERLYRERAGAMWHGVLHDRDSVSRIRLTPSAG
jgi:hypothetical protein